MNKNGTLGAEGRQTVRISLWWYVMIFLIDADIKKTSYMTKEASVSSKERELCNELASLWNKLAVLA